MPPTAGFPLVLIRGAGDLASGVAYRLAQAGFPVAMTELPHPLTVRTPVAFSSAVMYAAVVIEGVIGRRADLDRPDAIRALLAEGHIAVLVDPEGRSIRALSPAVLVDARMAKTNLGTRIDDAPLVIALGPGFTAGIDCHAVVETNRGHWLGRVYWTGSAESDTGIPASVNGKAAERALRAPADGRMRQVIVVGQRARAGDVLAWVGDAPLIAPFAGVVRGLIDDDIYVTTGQEIGDLDPHASRQHCFTLSDQALAVGGGVVEAILAAPQIRSWMLESARHWHSRHTHRALRAHRSHTGAKS